ncbi:MAG: hypothetical protein ACT4PG_09405 [Panacagrimonas sp.]
MSERRPISETAERYLRDQRLHEWAHSCLRKIRFPSTDKADRAVAKALRRRRVVLRHYYCNHCGGYHLTKRIT